MQIEYNTAMKTYKGGCHCGAVSYEVDTDLEETMVCNCSHCHKKGFILHFVPKENFRLLSGEGKLTSYKFNKKTVDHVFCSVCGVQSFSTNESYPKMMINVRCLEGVDTDSLSPKQVNGKDY